MGFSPLHATSVARVLNLTTKSIATQFHVVFDSFFSTAHADHDVEPDDWLRLLLHPLAHRQVELDEDDDLELADEWLNDTDRAARDQRMLERDIRHQREIAQQSSAPSTSSPTSNATNNVDEVSPSASQRETISSPSASQRETISKREGAIASSGPSFHESQRRRPLQAEQATKMVADESTGHQCADADASENPTHNVKRQLKSTNSSRRHNKHSERSPRSRQPPLRFQHNFGSASSWTDSSVALMSAICEENRHQLDDEHWETMMNLFADVDDLCAAPNPRLGDQPLAFAATKHDPDNPSYRSALAGDERDDWFESMEIEVDTLEARNCWTVVRRDQIGDAPVIPGMWCLKKKRRPSGDFLKCKARFVVRGDAMKSLDDAAATTAPVVSWTTV